MSKSLAKLRARVHVLEKDQQEGLSDPKLLTKTRALYRELVDSLSPSEYAWCRRVLFGQEDSPIQETQEILVSMDNFLSVVFGRRSVRKWNGEIPDDSFRLMVESALWAPSGCNRQPCEFLLIRDDVKIHVLGSIKGQAFISEAPSIILALINMEAYRNVKTPEMKEYFAHMDSGAAIQNLLLTGEYLGLGLCWVNIEPRNNSEIRSKLGIPDNYRVMAMIPAGLPDGETKPPGRKDLEGMIHYENWGSHTSSH